MKSARVGGTLQYCFTRLKSTLCTVYCALCTMHYALCTMDYALCTMHCALCTVHYALCTMDYALCTMHCALWTVHCALCTVHYALCIMHCVLFTVHYALCTVHCGLCMAVKWCGQRCFCRLTANIRIVCLFAGRQERKGQDRTRKGDTKAAILNFHCAGHCELGCVKRWK